jgi:hypothetical protein
MENKILSTLELNGLIREKAVENEAFRLALLSDPKKTLEEELGVEIPEDIKIEVHVENMKSLHLIIPPAQTDELTDEDLEGVAGGVAQTPRVVAMYAVRPLDNKRGIGWLLPLK